MSVESRCSAGVYGVVPTRIKAGEVFGRTWEILKARKSECLLGSVCYLLLLLVSDKLIGGIGDVLVERMPDREIAIPLAMFFADMFVFSWLWAGGILYFLKIARGEPMSLALLLNGGPYLIRVLVVNLLVGLATAAGLVLLIVPGIILILKFWPSVWVVVDRNVGMEYSLRLSREITVGNKLALFPVFLVMGIGMVLQMVGQSIEDALLTEIISGFGTLINGPVSDFLMTVAYLMMSGQMRPESKIETKTEMQ